MTVVRALCEPRSLPTSDRSAQRRLILGATRYFISSSDHRPDTQDAMGLDDDLLVLNYVVTAIGRPELVVEDA